MNDDGKGNVKVQELIYLSERLPEKFAEAIAKALAEIELGVKEVSWARIIDIELSTARDTPQLYDDFPEMPNCVIYLPDSTGTASIYFDSPGGHEFPMGTTFKKIRRTFRRLYVKNSAQSGSMMYLLLAKGDAVVESYTMTPADIQAQYRPVIASTATPLNASQEYTSSWYDCANYGKVTILSAADVAGTLKVQQSTDGSNADFESSWSASSVTIGGTTKYVVSAIVELSARYVRVIYTNSTSDQTWFRLTAMARVI